MKKIANHSKIQVKINRWKSKMKLDKMIDIKQATSFLKNMSYLKTKAEEMIRRVNNF